MKLTNFTLTSSEKSHKILIWLTTWSYESNKFSFLNFLDFSSINGKLEQVGISKILIKIIWN